MRLCAVSAHKKMDMRGLNVHKENVRLVEKYGKGTGRHGNGKPGPFETFDMSHHARTEGFHADGYWL